jgi:hypothetical protein
MQKPLIITRLQEEAETNPSVTIAAAGAFLMGAAKFIDAVSSARSKSAYARQINRRK